MRKPAITYSCSALSPGNVGSSYKYKLQTMVPFLKWWKL